jgi:nanoRNase/pAp phosphatase (c-di-AMP/oligoRNAs hydrolase)
MNLSSNLYKKITSLIESSNNISIFVHEMPDGDALGSALGLQCFLKNKFHKKNIKIIDIKNVKSEFLSKLFVWKKETINDI